MSERRQKTRTEDSASPRERRGAAPEDPRRGRGTLTAKNEPENSAETELLMEEVCDAANLEKAYRAVVSNKGSAGVDGMTVRQLGGYLKRRWPEIREALLAGTYQPQPVRRVAIPKPSGGTRSLGIPTVLDRLIQQALLQVLQPRWDPTFSERSYGFRPRRSAHQAVLQAQAYIAQGHRTVVDMDLEKFFDRVNHDILMSRMARRVKDKRVLKLIRAYLNAGVMENGLVSARTEGTPQGGPLSPLLSNLLLDDLDRELERRGHCFVRYADDCNIYVRSHRAGERVLKSITEWLKRRLKLTVNEAKSAVAHPWERKFLGFSFTNERTPRRRLAPASVKRFKARVRQITRRTRQNLHGMVGDLRRYLMGWRGYFGICETPSVLQKLDSWVRRRLRSAAWKHLKRGKARFSALRRRGVSKDLAAQTAGSPHGPWRISRSPALSYAFPNSRFDALGLPRLATR
jgi:RNA-directed DNA polymerase